MKKVLVRRKWFWWLVEVYKTYEHNEPVEYTYPKKFFSKQAAKIVARGIRFSE